MDNTIGSYGGLTEEVGDGQGRGEQQGEIGTDVIEQP